jgi:ATP-dependent RNA helicase SUPV3L1/SUV3
VLSHDGTIRWLGDPVAKLEPGDKIFEPHFRILADEQLTGPARDKVEARLRAWLKAYIVRLLGPAMQLEETAELTGLARGIAFQIAEALGVLERARVLNDVRSLDQDGRAALRRVGVRFGAYHLYLPALLKPAPRTLAAQLWALRNGGLDQRGIDEIAHLAGSGRTSIPVDPAIAPGLYRAAGFRVCGGRAVRVDILERLADLIRPAIAYRPGVTPGEPPSGAADGDGFVPTVAMTSLVGCAGEDFASILKSLGYVMESRPGPAITAPLVPAPSPVTPPAAEGEAAVADGEPVPDGRPAGETELGGSASGDAQANAVVDAVPTPPETPAAVEEGAGTAPALLTPVEPAPVGMAPVEIAPEEIAPIAVAPVEAAADPGTPAAPVEPTSGSADEPAEPALIEVWRLQRRHHEGGQARHGRGRSDRGERRHEARPRHDRAAGEHPRGEHPRGEHPKGEHPKGDHSRGERPPRHDRHREGRTEGQREDRQQGRPPRGPDRSEERRGPRPERRFEGPRGSGPDRRRDERREKQPDPDSPFAKLLALKAQLEDPNGGKR